MICLTIITAIDLFRSPSKARFNNRLLKEIASICSAQLLEFILQVKSFPDISHTFTMLSGWYVPQKRAGP